MLKVNQNLSIIIDYRYIIIMFHSFKASLNNLLYNTRGTKGSSKLNKFIYRIFKRFHKHNEKKE